MPDVHVGDSLTAEWAGSLARSKAFRSLEVGGDAPATLGGRIRALREAMDLSLRDLSERSGVSAPMLSQVERGETSPTLQVANRIAAGLDLRLSQLLRLDEDGAVTVVRRSARRQGPGDASGHRYEILTPPLPGQRAELSRHTLAAGARTGGPGDPPRHEPGSRETALVEAGVVILRCDGQQYELDEGDCVTFDADLNHYFENPGPGDAVLLAFLSAGLRRS
jgi:transcriptional regulator with XRE-family HTH domain